jgi:hypothetical protein
MSFVRPKDENRYMGTTRANDVTSDGPDHEHVIQVALAEFVALRAEIMGRTSSIAALVGIGLTALGVVVGFAVKNEGDVRLLLAMPPLAMLVNLLLSIEHRRVVLAGAYIRGPLWGVLRQHISEQLPCWEDEVQRRRSGMASAISVLCDGALIAAFAAAAVTGLVAARHEVRGILEDAEWTMAVAAALLPIALALATRAETRAASA